MRQIAFALACLACSGHGHGSISASQDTTPSLQSADKSKQAHSSSKTLRTLARLVLAFNPARALTLPKSGGLVPTTSRLDRSALVMKWPWEKPFGAPYAADSKAYDPVAADDFYGARPLLVGSRLFKLAFLTGGFNFRLLLDFLSYKWKGSPEDESWPNENDRAKEALGLATELGPTFIKLAQALSIRTDLIPEAYALQLRQLQDAVPPFDSQEAKEIIAKELGVSGGAAGLRSIFQTLSNEPLASASIGQVYKGVLKDGRTVAVKVQRPNILDDIALDLYILRLLVPIQTRAQNFINKLKTYPEDIRLATELVDEWGRGFVAESDYRYEAANTQEFSEAMVRRSLGAVTAPEIINEFCTNKVLVTGWVDGTRLDLDASPDVPRLCGVAINAYLTMLLDTGVLHCDPHPGNLLRTRDGKLCILDWGMTLGVPSDLQYALIEFIAHVNSEDFEAMPQDFVNLGFTPPDQLERVRQSNLADGLSFVLRQLSQGGGGKKLTERVREEWREQYDPEGKMTPEELRAVVRAKFTEQARMQLAAEGEDVSVMEVQNVIEKMQQRNREMFRVPPYILYVLRAFSTLEGIGLSATEDYAIVTEAFPYLSRRLLTDKSPRAKAALRSMVYGSENKDATNATPDFSRVLSMGEGFTSYSSATSGMELEAPMNGGTAGAATTVASPNMDTAAVAVENALAPATSPSSAAMDSATDDLIDLLLSSDGNYVQELILEEAAKLTDAAVRDSLKQVGSSAPINVLTDALRAPKQLADSIVGRLPLPGPLKSAVDAALLPATVLDEVSRLVPTLAGSGKSDNETLNAFGTLWDKLNPRPADSPQEGELTTDQVSADSTEPAGGNNVLATVQTNAGPLLEQLADPESRLRKRLPMIGTLSRRFGATLLRRVASRIEEDASRSGSTGLAREVGVRAAEAERSLAGFIEPEATTSKELVESQV
mmetsp:Transcript_17047/g.31996  ORF Transcript_17047/g.31996 Transcript_17047/m.31996 type:complete len:944 (+) Transcript_17047:63-2894(+)